MSEAPGTLPAVLAQRVALTPQATAFHSEQADGSWQAISWQDFEAQVARLALALYRCGLRKGDRLALIAQVGLQWELLHHAALRMGVVLVGLDAHDQATRVASMAAQAGVVAIATSAPSVTAALSREQMAACKLLLLMEDAKAPAPTAGLVWRSWSDLAALSATASDSAAPSAVEASDEATLIFTSGTTGTPKGIAYSHAQLRLAVDAICSAYAFVGPESRLLCWLPLSNLFQRVVNLAALQQGAATSLLADPRRVMSVVAQVSPRIFIGVPRFFEKLHEGLVTQINGLPPLQRRLVRWAWAIGRRARTLQRAGRKPPLWLGLAHQLAERALLRRVRGVMGNKLACMVTGSAPTPVHLLEELHALGWLVLESYGMSENILPMAMNTVDHYRFGSVGRPVQGNQIVVDAQGCVKVKGAGVFRGYLGDPPGRSLDPNGYYLTGDIGALDEDGFLRLSGRNSELIKTSTGRRVAPAAPEAALRRIAGVEQALVIGAGRKSLVALCACSVDLSSATARQELRDALREQLAQLGLHERPLAIALIGQPFSIEAGELTPNLKLRRDFISGRYAGLIEDLYALADAPGSSDAKFIFADPLAPAASSPSAPSAALVAATEPCHAH